jgi:hypothetical protein
MGWALALRVSLGVSLEVPKRDAINGRMSNRNLLTV